ncbi:hypothetical protein AOLI_G00302980 [Acnodon oligacanthus]
MADRVGLSRGDNDRWITEPHGHLVYLWNGLCLLESGSGAPLNWPFRECLCKPGQITAPITGFVGSVWPGRGSCGSARPSFKTSAAREWEGKCGWSLALDKRPAHEKTLDSLTDKFERWRSCHTDERNRPKCGAAAEERRVE